MPIDLHEKLGTTPFGERHLGSDAATGQALLVTRLRLDDSRLDDTLKARILDAARRYAGLVHPHICAPATAGFTQAGRLVVAQEAPLSVGLGPGSGQAAESGVETLVHVCEGLAYAHARGMVHGALTRDCVFSGGPQGTRVADFGVGAALYETGTLAARSQAVTEIAPEVKAGAEPTTASDVYALGVIGIDLCSTGGGPAAQSLAERARRVPGIGLATVLGRAIESDPKARYATAEEMLGHLRNVAAPRTAPQARAATRKPARSRAPKQPEPPAVPEMSYPKAFGLILWTVLRSGLALLLALCLIAAAVAGGLALAFRSTPGLVTVPNLEGKTVAEATKLAEGKGLQVTIGREAHSEDVPAGRVIEHLPYPGKVVREGRSVELVVSLGPPRAKVPDLVGKSRADALERLESLGLRLGTVSRKPDSPKPAEQVLSQNPPPGKEVAIDTEVNVIVSGNRRTGTGPTRSGPRAADVSFIVPEGPVVQRVKVEVHYPSGRYDVVYERIHRPGDRRTVHVVASGEATVQILIDGELVAEYDLEPSP
ncbi:MAG: PASTA domain-containing protein [Armatimonadetes bacterium]|nr:PASTA domain-containing protein [Armatimonadota bacterium]